MTNVFRSLAALLVLAVLLLSASGEEVTVEMAAKVVGNWRAQRGQLGLSLGRSVAESHRVERNGAKFNLVKMEGGGFVITPADTKIRPIILFSDGDDFDISDENPALALLYHSRSPVAKRAALLRSNASQNSCPSCRLLDGAELAGYSPMMKGIV